MLKAFEAAAASQGDCESCGFPENLVLDSDSFLGPFRQQLDVRINFIRILRNVGLFRIVQDFSRADLTPQAIRSIAGGSGAGPTWEGTSGVHTHMTNTRSTSSALALHCHPQRSRLKTLASPAVTDPEILERRYPTILHQFSIRQGSGGDGQHRGGDGVVREIEFLE